MKNVTAAVVLYNSRDLIPALSETIKLLPSDMRTVIYDSGSSDGSAELASSLLGSSTVIRGSNHGFGFGNNRCLEKIDTEYTLLLNSDASIDGLSLEKLVAFLDDNPDHAGVQPLIRLWGWEKVTVSSGVYLTEYGEAWDSRFMHLELAPLRTTIQVPAITAAVALFRTEALRSVNGFDESFFMYFEDADLSLRLGAEGWKLAVERSAEAIHMVGASSKRLSALKWELESSIRMFRRYFGSGRLSSMWWRREARIAIHSVIRGKSPFWRTAVILKALRGKERVGKVPEELEAILFGDPMDLPGARTEGNSRGPGWKGNVVSPWAGFRGDGNPVDLQFTALSHSVTGTISAGSGELLKRFIIPADSKREVKLAKTTSVVYIHCDSFSDRVEVTLSQ
ncbi:MAG: glycosyltransferase family 2 protein [Candidatus Fermentibacteria bacterium]|nr:glycosyltransferase family 2 protein [Candidatus Fermentibacteria bacterium]